MKKKVVVFNKNNAITKEVNFLRKYKKLYDLAIIEPDLMKIQDVPSHFWKLEDSNIVEMKRPEKLQRLEDIKKNGLDQSDPTKGIGIMKLVSIAFAVTLVTTSIGVYLWQM